jgi:hypothetical protein
MLLQLWRLAPEIVLPQLVQSMREKRGLPLDDWSCLSLIETILRGWRWPLFLIFDGLSTCTALEQAKIASLYRISENIYFCFFSEEENHLSELVNIPPTITFPEPLPESDFHVDSESSISCENEWTGEAQPSSETNHPELPDAPESEKHERGLAADVQNDPPLQPTTSSSNSRRGWSERTEREERSTVPTSGWDHSRESTSTGITPFPVTDEVKLASTSDRKQNHEHSEAMREEVADDTYSDAGSIADYEETFVNVLQNEILQDLHSIDLPIPEKHLPPLLEEFAIRLGHVGDTKDHKTMMYIAHKYRR